MGAEFQPRGIAPKPQHRLLRHVLSLRIIPQHAPCNRQYRRQMPVDKTAKCLAVTRGDASEQFRLLPIFIGLGPGNRTWSALVR
jgi:hypothetical protein